MVTQDQTKDGPAKARFTELSSLRDAFMRRAEDAAALTIPGIVPPEGHDQSANLDQPWQSLGAHGVNNLAAKLLLALFPPAGNFFRLSVADHDLEDELKTAGAEANEEVESILADMERRVQKRLEQTGARAPLFSALLHLVVSGNVCIQVLKDCRLKMFPLRAYVCKRDREGEPIEIIIKECLSPATLPADVKLVYDEYAPKDGGTPQNIVDVYTHLKLVKGSWDAYQEVVGVSIPGSQGKYPKDKPAFIPLRLYRVEGEDYGRGHVEAYMGDLNNYDSLSQTITEGSAIMAKIIPFVDEGGTVDAAAFAKARNGKVLTGKATDVSVWQVEKAMDFRVAFERLGSLERSLGEAFLLGSAVRRDAERVTAEEIRVIAAELEQQLGGVYSVLAVEMQLPLVARLLFQMGKTKDLPKLPEGAVKPTVVTGLEALGRSSDLMKMDLLLKGVAEAYGPEAVGEYTSCGNYIQIRALALGLDPKKLGIKSEKEVQEGRAQKAQQEMNMAVAPKAIDAQLQREQMAAQAQPQG